MFTKSTRKHTERSTIDTLSTHFWLGTGSSIKKNGGINLFPSNWNREVMELFST